MDFDALSGDRGVGGADQPGNPRIDPSESWASALSSLSWASSRSVVTAFERKAPLAALRRATPSPYTRPVKFRDRESQLSLILTLGRLFAVPNSAKSCFLTADELSSRLQTTFG
jgi:hypothetical protein